ncbi:hypothetical protein CDAR_17551 [Caerostris darwini]|uniref:Uncharacterized protein n=1 Tax=Caerostris darwini TaxID=1538125 RepID=A0AAV4NCL8_9ARAC|nr:hypothetical protein CDAR_17551 [Caerostris darwini]
MRLPQNAISLYWSTPTDASVNALAYWGMGGRQLILKYPGDRVAKRASHQPDRPKHPSDRIFICQKSHFLEQKQYDLITFRYYGLPPPVRRRGCVMTGWSWLGDFACCVKNAAFSWGGAERWHENASREDPWHSLHFNSCSTNSE